MKNLEARQREMRERHAAILRNSNNALTGPPPRPQLVAPPPARPGSKPARSVTPVHGLIRNAKGQYDTGYKVDEGQHLRLLQEASGRRDCINVWTG